MRGPPNLNYQTFNIKLNKMNSNQHPQPLLPAAASPVGLTASAAPGLDSKSEFIGNPRRHTQNLRNFEESSRSVQGLHELRQRNPGKQRGLGVGAAGGREADAVTAKSVMLDNKKLSEDLPK